MGSLFDKARITVFGKMNDLLDEVANTPSAYKQRIRDLESALADLRAAIDESVGTATGYKRQITEFQSQAAHKQADIDLLLGDNDPSNDQAALDLQLEVEQLTGQITQYEELLTQAQTNTTALQKAEQQLEAKHQEMVTNLSRITLTAAATSAKNRASSAVEAAMDASSGTDAGVDSIEARIHRDADTADARFARVVGGMDTAQSPEQAAALARAKAAIAARRAQITGVAQELPAGSPVTTP